MMVVATNPRGGPRFAPGQRVHLRRFNGAHAYVVDGPRPYAGGWEYRVIVEGAADGPSWQGEHLMTRCFEHQTCWRTPDEFRRDLLLAKIRFRLSDTLYSYRASRTLFEPYQFRPVLRFLASQQQRLLIADEVGLGKTIEAAMIYLELKARLGSELKRVLIACPSRLRSKWQDELRSRFDEEFRELHSAQDVRFLLNRWRELGDAYRFRAIVSYELLRSETLATEWARRGVRLDLLIADEAHVMRNTSSLTHALGAILTDNADAAIFLTATPLMLDNADLFNLLHLLAPDEFDDVRSFPEQVRPNQYVNQAARAIGDGDARAALGQLRLVEMTTMRERFLKDPRYQDTLAALRTLGATDIAPSLGDRVRLQRQVLELNTLSAIFTRTRKREVANAKPRQAHTVKVTLSPGERAFYDAFLAQVRHDIQQANGGAASFAIVMRERMAASCLAATRQALVESFQQRTTRSLEVEHSEFHLTAEDDDRQAREEWLRSTRELLALAQAIGDADAKFDRFEETLRTALAERAESKALIFSYFRGTLRYLLDRLGKLGYRVGVIHGGISIEERQKTIETFRDDPKFRVLLSSEVGAEGLDFQFCDVLVNYDLPWNPMQVEQRIGRLDRFGQEADKIRIYSFAIDNSIETRIIQRLYDRINIFERSIGDLEAILGEEIRKLSLAAIRATLTPEQEEEEAERAARRIEARRQAQEELERQQDELVGQGAILDASVGDAVDGGHVVFPQEVRSLVCTYLNVAIDPPAIFDRDDDEDCWTLRVTPALREALDPYTVDGGSEAGATDRFKSAIANLGVVALTFDADLARRRPLLELITARHALAVAARDYWEEAARCVLPATRVELPGPAAEAGDGYVFVYAMVEEGIARLARLHAVVVLDDGRAAPRTAETILRWIATSDHPSTPIAVGPLSVEEARVKSDAIVAEQRDQAERLREQRNAAVVAARRAAITTSFAAKERSIQAALTATTNAAARQMNLGRLAHLRARRDEKLAELDTAASVSVSSQLVALARVRIVPAARATEPELALPVEATPSSEQLEAGLSVRIGPDGAASHACAPAAAVVCCGQTTDSSAPDDTVDTWPSEADDAPLELGEDDRARDADEPLSAGGHVLAVTAFAIPERANAAQADHQDEGPGGVATPTLVPPAPSTAADGGPAGHGSQSGSLPDPTAASPRVLPPDVAVGSSPARALRFPGEAAVGTLYGRARKPGGLWQELGAARGVVSVDGEVEVRLCVDPEAAGDLGWLTSLAPDDLVSLVLDGVALGPRALDALGRLRGLRELSCCQSSIGDREIGALRPLASLSTLRLAGSRVGNLGVLNLKALPGLHFLDLSGTLVDGGGAVHLPGLRSLTELLLADTKLSDGGLVHLVRLPSLHTLGLARTSITDGGIIHMARMPALRRLDLRGTRTTAAGLRRLPPHVEVLHRE